MTADPLAFLRHIWRGQQQDGYVFISAKLPDGSWIDHPMKLGNIERTKSMDAILNEGDLYFAPCVFKDKTRRKGSALPSRWLYADLDEVKPATLKECPPTLEWMTSPGRYQCAWLLDEPLGPRAHARLNQKMTYYTGADKGGWSVTKVLRIPGTPNHKYEGDPLVALLRPPRKHVFSRAELVRLTRDTDTPATAAAELGSRNLPTYSPEQIRRIMRRRHASARARKLVRAGTRAAENADRSQRLWELECSLARTGMKPETIVGIVRSTVWNKYQGQRRELAMLWAEAVKAVAEAAPPPKKTRKKRASRSKSKPQERAGLQLMDVGDFVTRRLPRPTWLVEDVWSEQAHGILAGQAKVFKSLFTMDLAVSIASGTPFLNRFHVPTTGPVIMIQEENRPGLVQDRLLRIMNARGIGPVAHTNNGNVEFGTGDLPLSLMNNKHFDLTSLDDIKWLARQCVRRRPALVILDPLYLMTPGLDENSAKEMTPILARLLKIKQAVGCGIQIVHHYHKPKPDTASLRGGHRISGTGVFHRWLASALYVEETDQPNTVLITGEHREHAPMIAYQVRFDLGVDDEEDLTYGVRIREWNGQDEDSDELEDLIGSANGKQLVVAKVAEELGLTTRQVQRRALSLGHEVKKARIKGATHLVVVRSTTN